MQTIDTLTADQLAEGDFVQIEGDVVRITTDPADNGDSIYFWGWNYSSNESEEFVLFPDERVNLLGA